MNGESNARVNAKGQNLLNSLRKTLGVGFLKGHGFQPCRKSLKSMQGSARSRALSRRQAAAFDVFPQAVKH
jgi:hypothetical protein